MEEDDFSKVFLSNTFSEKVIIAYTKRHECQKYLKHLLEKPIIAILKIGENLTLAPEKLIKSK